MRRDHDVLRKICAMGLIAPTDLRSDLFVVKIKFSDSHRVLDPGRSYRNWSYTSPKPKKVASGDTFPGRIHADLSAIASEYQDPGQFQIGRMH